MDSFGFALPRSVIDVENLHHSLTNQMQIKLKLIMTWLLSFSHTLGILVGFTVTSRWLLKYFLSSNWPF